MNIGNEQHKKETENRIDSLVNLAKKQARTERHLEEYSDRESAEDLGAAKRLQNIRTEEIQNIKNNISGKNEPSANISEDIQRFDIY